MVLTGHTPLEPNETFFVNLTNPVGAALADAQGQGTITNDDAGAPPALSISDVSLYEGNRGTRVGRFAVGLSAPSASTVTVAFATANGTASSVIPRGRGR